VAFGAWGGARVESCVRVAGRSGSGPHGAMTKLPPSAAVAQSADAVPSKGTVLRDVWVRVPPAALRRAGPPARTSGSLGSSSPAKWCHRAVTRRVDGAGPLSSACRFAARPRALSSAADLRHAPEPWPGGAELRNARGPGPDEWLPGATNASLDQSPAPSVGLCAWEPSGSTFGVGGRSSVGLCVREPSGSTFTVGRRPSVEFLGRERADLTHRARMHTGRRPRSYDLLQPASHAAMTR
jgi:hypothetical protein